jgi:dolichol-phosphate mannosyltransferase
MEVPQAGPAKLTVVVPFLNEAENLPALYERLCAVLETEPGGFEVLFVDDGSSDGSAGWVVARAAQDARVKLLRLSRNFGHQLAITAGMDHADGDAVVIMDADLQDPPEVVPDLLKRWREGHEIARAAAANPGRSASWPRPSTRRSAAWRAWMCRSTPATSGSWTAR